MGWDAKNTGFHMSYHLIYHILYVIDYVKKQGKKTKKTCLFCCPFHLSYHPIYLIYLIYHRLCHIMLRFADVRGRMRVLLIVRKCDISQNELGCHPSQPNQEARKWSANSNIFPMGKAAFFPMIVEDPRISSLRKPSQDPKNRASTL